eukprot:3745166-Pyramimonas_sp.AAC.1
MGASDYAGLKGLKRASAGFRTRAKSESDLPGAASECAPAQADATAPWRRADRCGPWRGAAGRGAGRAAARG